MTTYAFLIHAESKKIYAVKFSGPGKVDSAFGPLKKEYVDRCREDGNAIPWGLAFGFSRTLGGKIGDHLDEYEILSLSEKEKA